MGIMGCGIYSWGKYTPHAWWLFNAKDGDEFEVTHWIPFPDHRRRQTMKIIDPSYTILRVCVTCGSKINIKEEHEA